LCAAESSTQGTYATEGKAAGLAKGANKMSSSLEGYQTQVVINALNGLRGGSRGGVGRKKKSGKGRKGG